MGRERALAPQRPEWVASGRAGWQLTARKGQLLNEETFIPWGIGVGHDHGGAEFG